MFWISLTYAALGDKDEAFAWLEKGLERRDLVIFIRPNPSATAFARMPDSSNWCGVSAWPLELAWVK
jgi:hypothetical protein